MRRLAAAASQSVGVAFMRDPDLAKWEGEDSDPVLLMEWGRGQKTAPGLRTAVEALREDPGRHGVILFAYMQAWGVSRM